MKDNGITLIEKNIVDVLSSTFREWVRLTDGLVRDRKIAKAQAVLDGKLIEQEMQAQQAAAVLKKKLAEMSSTIRGEIGQDRLVKEQTRMQLEEFRTRAAMLFEENQTQLEELTSLRSKVLVSATETTWMWRTANEAMAAQRERLEKQNKESLQATKKGFEQQLADRTLRQQRELEGKIYDLEDENSHQKMVIKSLLEEQADTIAEEALVYERTQMAAEDHMSKAWMLTEKLVESDDLRQRMETMFASHETMHGVMKSISVKESADHLEALTKAAEDLQRKCDEQQQEVNLNAGKIAVLENQLRATKEALVQSENQVQKLQVFCLQPQMPPATGGSGAGGRGGPKKPEEQDLKGLMKGFLQELLKGKKMKLQTEGGGPPTPTILSITKDLKFLTLKAGTETFKIPMDEIQQIVPGKDLPADVWTSTPVDENTVTIVFGPSTDEQHTAAFREDTIEERDKFVNSLKVLRLAMVQNQ